MEIEMSTTQILLLSSLLLFCIPPKVGPIHYRKATHSPEKVHWQSRAQMLAAGRKLPSSHGHLDRKLWLQQHQHQHQHQYQHRVESGNHASNLNDDHHIIGRAGFSGNDLHKDRKKEREDRAHLELWLKNFRNQRRMQNQKLIQDGKSQGESKTTTSKSQLELLYTKNTIMSTSTTVFASNVNDSGKASYKNRTGKVKPNSRSSLNFGRGIANADANDNTNNDKEKAADNTNTQGENNKNQAGPGEKENEDVKLKSDSGDEEDAENGDGDAAAEGEESGDEYNNPDVEDPDEPEQTWQDVQVDLFEYSRKNDQEHYYRAPGDKCNSTEDIVNSIARLNASGTMTKYQHHVLERRKCLWYTYTVCKNVKDKKDKDKKDKDAKNSTQTEAESEYRCVCDDDRTWEDGACLGYHGQGCRWNYDCVRNAECLGVGEGNSDSEAETPDKADTGNVSPPVPTDGNANPVQADDPSDNNNDGDGDDDGTRKKRNVAGARRTLRSIGQRQEAATSENPKKEKHPMRFETGTCECDPFSKCLRESVYPPFYEDAMGAKFKSSVILVLSLALSSSSLLLNLQCYSL